MMSQTSGTNLKNLDNWHICSGMKMYKYIALDIELKMIGLFEMAE